MHSSLILLLQLLSLVFICLVFSAEAYSLRSLLEQEGRYEPVHKRSEKCKAFEPFQCPDGTCVPISYLCDGSADCSDGYDENENMCTAAMRPPVEETTQFLQALLSAHGKNFFTKIFGPKAANAMQEMGGVAKVAVALSESRTAESFGSRVGLDSESVNQMKNTLNSIIDGETGLGFSSQELNDFKFYLEKLGKTGFL